MPTELQCLFRSPRPVRGWLHGDRVVVGCAAGRVWCGTGNHLVGSSLRLSELPCWDRLGTTQIVEIWIILVPAVELPSFQAHSCRSFSQPRLGPPVVHAVADRPGNGNLSCKTFPASLAEKVRARTSRSLSEKSYFSPSEKKPALGGLV